MTDKKLNIGAERTNNPKLLQAQKMISDYIESLPLVMEFDVLMAKQKKHRYEQLLKQGFTPEQSLELVKAWK